jgi:hypothetical protein
MTARAFLHHGALLGILTAVLVLFTPKEEAGYLCK